MYLGIKRQVFLFIICSSCAAYSQDTVYTFIPSNKIKVYSIHQITDSAYFSAFCGCGDTSANCHTHTNEYECYYTWDFNNGILVKASFSDGGGGIENTPYTYESSKGRIYERDGNGLLGPATNSYAQIYMYDAKGKMDTVLDLTSWHGETDTSLTIIYGYYKSGKLKNADENNDEEKSDNYFIYKKDNIIGFISLPPAYDQYENGIEYYMQNVLTAKQIQDNIDASYTRIKSNYLLFNGVPVNKFLHLNMRNVNYLVIEIYDNHFLFYKISD